MLSEYHVLVTVIVVTVFVAVAICKVTLQMYQVKQKQKYFITVIFLLKALVYINETINEQSFK